MGSLKRSTKEQRCSGPRKQMHLDLNQEATTPPLPSLLDFECLFQSKFGGRFVEESQGEPSGHAIIIGCEAQVSIPLNLDEPSLVLNAPVHTEPVPNMLQETQQAHTGTEPIAPEEIARSEPCQAGTPEEGSTVIPNEAEPQSSSPPSSAAESIKQVPIGLAENRRPKCFCQIIPMEHLEAEAKRIYFKQLRTLFYWFKREARKEQLQLETERLWKELPEEQKMFYFSQVVERMSKDLHLLDPRNLSQTQRRQLEYLRTEGKPSFWAKTTVMGPRRSPYDHPYCPSCSTPGPRVNPDLARVIGIKLPPLQPRPLPRPYISSSTGIENDPATPLLLRRYSTARKARERKPKLPKPPKPPKVPKPKVVREKKVKVPNPPSKRALARMKKAARAKELEQKNESNVTEPGSNIKKRSTPLEVIILPTTPSGPTLFPKKRLITFEPLDFNTPSSPTPRPESTLNLLRRTGLSEPPSELYPEPEPVPKPPELQYNRSRDDEAPSPVMNFVFERSHDGVLVLTEVIQDAHQLPLLWEGTVGAEELGCGQESMAEQHIWHDLVELVPDTETGLGPEEAPEIQPRLEMESAVEDDVPAAAETNSGWIGEAEDDEELARFFFSCAQDEEEAFHWLLGTTNDNDITMSEFD